jgi:hypothetical protein
MREINSLSAQCRNTAGTSPGSIQSLFRTYPHGTVHVMRIGAMAGPDWGYEIVTTHLLGGGELQIILSSAEGETWGIPFTLRPESVIVGDRADKITLSATFFDGTFIDPDYDRQMEVCPFIYTLNHKDDFIVVVGQDPFFHPVSARDDWHNNSYTQILDMGIGQHLLSYYETIKRVISEVHVAFSFSPYTAFAGFSHTDRYIDHVRRLYIPILNRDGEIAEELTGMIGFPFGKKPFTLGEDGTFLTYREVVRPSTTVAVPDLLKFNLQLFWPFIPYLREIPNFNLHFLSPAQLGSPATASLQNFDPAYVHELRYDPGGRQSLRADSLSLSYPDATYTTDTTSNLDPANSVVTGRSDWNERTDQTITYTITKSATLGTVGGLKDLFVLTTLTGVVEHASRLDGELVRTSNFPGVYYMPEFVDDLFWPCGRMTDVTDASESYSDGYTVEITGSQVLKVGDVEIDRGSITLSYTGTDTRETVHNGTASRYHACDNPTAIGYTTTEMDVLEEQQFTCLDENGDVINCEQCEWVVVSGGGQINQQGVYTAPATNANCASNPIIGIECDGVVILTLALAINGVTDNSTAYWIKQGCEDAPTATCPAGSYHCCTYLTYDCRGQYNGYVNTASGGYPCAPGTEPYDTCASSPSIQDVRSGELLEAGCCPGELI